MKICNYSKCGKEFEPKKPKQVFCSDVHRVYANREKNAAQKAVEPPKPVVQDLNKQSAGKTQNVSEKASKSNYTINTGRPKNLDELKKMCPIELSGFDKSAWVATERQKYGI